MASVDKLRVLFVSDDADERWLVQAALAYTGRVDALIDASAPGDVLEVLAAGSADVVVASERVGWTEPTGVLRLARRHNPECTTVALARFAAD